MPPVCTTQEHHTSTQLTRCLQPLGDAGLLESKLPLVLLLLRKRHVCRSV